MPSLPRDYEAELLDLTRIPLDDLRGMGAVTLELALDRILQEYGCPGRELWNDD